MIDIQWISSHGAVLVSAAFAPLSGIDLLTVLEVVAWFAATACLGVMLSWLLGPTFSSPPARKPLRVVKPKVSPAPAAARQSRRRTPLLDGLA